MHMDQDGRHLTDGKANSKIHISKTCRLFLYLKQQYHKKRWANWRKSIKWPRWELPVLCPRTAWHSDPQTACSANLPTSACQHFRAAKSPSDQRQAQGIRKEMDSGTEEQWTRGLRFISSVRVPFHVQPGAEEAERSKGQFLPYLFSWFHVC